MELNRVVITGMGVVAPNSIGLDAYLNLLRKGDSDPGTSGIVDILEAQPTFFDGYFDPFLPLDAKTPSFPVKRAGLVKGFDPKKIGFDPKTIKTNSMAKLYAYTAAKEALEDSGLEIDPDGELTPLDVIVMLGSSMADPKQIEDSLQTLINRGPRWISPFDSTNVASNGPAGYVAGLYSKGRLAGQALAISSACASSTSAIGEAYDKLRLGRAKAAFAGGVEMSTTPLSLAQFLATKALSTTEGGISRPTDIARDGFVMSDGAGMIVLETLDHALERRDRGENVNIYGEIIGHGVTTDTHSVTQPTPEALTYTMTQAILDARESVGFDEKLALDDALVVAHLSSTPQGDFAEARAIRNIYERYSGIAQVTGLKSKLGHTTSPSGVIELIGGLLAMRYGFIPPIINVTELDPKIADLNLDLVLGKARGAHIQLIYKNAAGFQGHTDTLIVRRFTE